MAVPRDGVRWRAAVRHRAAGAECRHRCRRGSPGDGDILINPLLVPGALVRHPGRPDWGRGQVQSVDGNRVTVNFAEAGKRTIDAEQVELTVESGNPETGRVGPDAY